MIRILVDNRVRIPREDLVGNDGLREALLREFTHQNPAHQNDPNNEPAFDRTWRDEAGWLTLPRGGMSRVRRLVEAVGPFRVVDHRAEGLAQQLPHCRKLWAHQVRIVDAIGRRQNCLVRASTGAGKTSAAIAAACRFGRWSCAVVWTKGLMTQWVERIVEECGVAERDVGIVQGKTRRLRPFTVAMQQTLAQHPLSPEEVQIFGFVVLDETQRAAANTVFAAVDPFPAKYRVGISADERRRDEREYLIYDLFGEVAEEVSREEVVDAGITHDVQVAIVPTGYAPGPWYRSAVASGNRYKIQWAQRKLAEDIAGDVGRVKLAADLACQALREGGTVAVLANRREQCGAIAAEIRRLGHAPGFMLGGKADERDFEDAKQRVKAGTLKIVVGTIQAVGTGIDVPAFDRGIVCSHVSNNEQLFNQVRGLFCRRSDGKTGARLTYLWDRGAFGMKAIENLCRWNDDVVVLDGTQWVRGKDFLNQQRHARSTISRRTA